MSYKAYSEAEIAEALVKLAINKNDFDKTSAETGISTGSLKRWSKMQRNDSVPVLIEDTIKMLLLNIPDKISGHDWAITLGILLDKYLLINGAPTQRTESINHSVSELTDDEYQRELEAAQESIRRLSQGAGTSEDANVADGVGQTVVDALHQSDIPGVQA